MVHSHLRQLNPSPYMFYVDCGNSSGSSSSSSATDGLRLVGASPECLCKVEKNVVTNHAIAGTVHRGKSAEGGFLDVSLRFFADLFHLKRTTDSPQSFLLR